MADEPEDDEPLLLDEPIEAEEQEAPETEAETDEPDEISVSFGDEEAPDGEDLPSHLRRQLRERDKTIAELRRAAPAEKPPEIGDKPTLESSGYDEGKYEEDLLAWNERSAAIKQQTATANKQREAIETDFRAKLEDFGRKRDAMKAPDFEDAESLVVGATSQLQQTIMVKAADDPAKFIYALGRHPAKLAELAAITDPVELIKAVVKLEGSIKVTTKRRGVEPEGTVRGSAPLSVAKDAGLEKLEREADRDPNFDRGRIVRYKREMAEKRASRR